MPVLSFFSNFYFFVNRCYLSIDLQSIQYYLIEYAVHGFGFVEFKLPLDKALKDKRLRKKFPLKLWHPKSSLCSPFCQRHRFQLPASLLSLQQCNTDPFLALEQARRKERINNGDSGFEGVPLARKRGILKVFVICTHCTIP